MDVRITFAGRASPTPAELANDDWMQLIQAMGMAVALIGHPQPHGATCSPNLVAPRRAAVGQRISVRLPPSIDPVRHVSVILTHKDAATDLPVVRTTRRKLTVQLTASRLASLRPRARARSALVDVVVRAGARQARAGCLTVTGLDKLASVARKSGTGGSTPPATPRPPTRSTTVSSTTTSSPPTDTTTVQTPVAPLLPTATTTAPPATTTTTAATVTTPPNTTSTTTATGTTTTAGTAHGAPLSWAPPGLTTPQTVMLTSGRDPDHVSLNTSRDYILVIPAGGIRGTVEIDGGHNVVLIGGSITVPASANQTDNGTDNTDTALYITHSTGTVHVEGLSITADPGTQFDGIDINAPAATVQLENIRVASVWGSDNTEHADVVQSWGGVRDLRVDNLTADGDYQGLTVAPDLGEVGSVELENVDLTLDPRPSALSASTIGGGYMLWLTKNINTCSSPGSMTFDDVYIDNQSHRVADGNTAWPGVSGNSLSCAGVLTDHQMTWPKLPVSGAVTLTAAPDGPFVPVGSVGDSYVSPGYLSVG